MDTYESIGGAQRIKVLSNPPALPGHCAVCGYAGGEDRTFLDFGLDIEFYGAVFFCSTCVISICNELGYTTPERYDLLAVKFIAERDKNIKLQEQNDSLKLAVDSIRFASAEHFNSNDVDKQQESDDGEVASDDTRKAARDSEQADSKLIKQIKLTRSNDVSGDGSNELKI